MRRRKHRDQLSSDWRYHKEARSRRGGRSGAHAVPLKAGLNFGPCGGTGRPGAHQPSKLKHPRQALPARKALWARRHRQFRGPAAKIHPLLGSSSAPKLMTRMIRVQLVLATLVGKYASTVGSATVASACHAVPAGRPGSVCRNAACARTSSLDSPKRAKIACQVDSAVNCLTIDEAPHQR